MSAASGINIGNVGRDFSQRAGGDIVAGNKTTVTIIVQRHAKELTSTPYKFLASYDVADRDIFYGRVAVVEKLAGEVARHKVIVINGASGAGKSSLVNAGVIPRLAENGYTYVCFREYSDPLAQFSNFGTMSTIEAAASDGSATLASLGTVVASRSESGEAKPPDFNNPSSLLELIRAKHSIPMVVVLDQFERFFINVSTERRNAFIAALKHCVYNSTAKELNFVIGLRSEFYGQLLAEFEPQMPEFLNEAYRFNLLPLTQSEAREAIVRPLENTGLKIQYDEDFVDKVLLVRLAAQAGGNTNVNPPHLQIVCNELFEAARQLLLEKSSVLINETFYNTLGGVQTILNTYLDKAVEEVAREPERIMVVRSVLQRMIDTTGTRRFVSQEILKRELPDVDAAELATIIARLVDRRVIEDRSPTYSLSHEYMVPQVKGWFDPIEMERKRAQETLERGLAERNNSKALLSRSQVEAVRKWATGLTPEEHRLLEDSENDYLEKERQEAERERQLLASQTARRRVVQIGFAVAIVLTSIALWQWGKALRESKLTLARQLAAQSDLLRSGEVNSLEPSALLAIQSIKTARLFENDHSLREVLALLPRRVSTLVEDGFVLAVAFSSDGHYVATGGVDSTVRVFEAATGKVVWRRDQIGISPQVVFSRDGRYLAAGDREDTNTAWVFEAATGKEVSRMIHGGSIESVTFSPDGRYVATGSADKTARVFEAATGKEVSRLVHGSSVQEVAFSPDGRYVATGSADKTARVFEAATGKEVSRLTDLGPVNSVAFSPDGRLVAVGAGVRDVGTGSAGVFEAATGREVCDKPKTAVFLR